ncbi:hypothetical protein HanIR_Chr03g0135391 [Helianthus annuus]|nr:hypothetical protein HanIR_Chr03g0135391 [Helianthus annuus]
MLAKTLSRLLDQLRLNVTPEKTTAERERMKDQDLVTDEEGVHRSSSFIIFVTIQWWLRCPSSAIETNTKRFWKGYLVMVSGMEMDMSGEDESKGGMWDLSRRLTSLWMKKLVGSKICIEKSLECVWSRDTYAAKEEFVMKRFLVSLDPL